MTAILVIVILVVLIVVHELGHFLAAKMLGVKVEEFGVGYPPRAFRFAKIGDTEYTLNWIPFGGFVRLFGDEGQMQRGRGSFVDAPRGKQAAILVAGVCMNVIAAWAIFTGAYALGIPRAVDVPGPGVNLLISDVVPGSPADAAGIKPGDDLIGMMDKKGMMLTDLTPDGVKNYVVARNGQPITIVYVANGATSTTQVTPANAVIAGAGSQPALGIGLVLVSSEPLSFSSAAGDAVSTTWSGLESVVQQVGWIVKSAVVGNLDLSNIIGPVGLVSAVGQASQAGFAQVLALAAFISVNLAVINLIPIPALDGGRLVIVGVEALMRRPAPKLIIHLLNIIGIGAIIFLMVVVTYQDILRLVA